MRRSESHSNYGVSSFDAIFATSMESYTFEGKDSGTTHQNSEANHDRVHYNQLDAQRSSPLVFEVIEL